MQDKKAILTNRGALLRVTLAPVLSEKRKALATAMDELNTARKNLSKWAEQVDRLDMEVQAVCAMLHDEEVKDGSTNGVEQDTV